MATTVPVTGLTMLGQQLLQGATDFANQRDEQRRREERLSDIQANRSYEEGQFNRLRQFQLDDEQRRRTEGLEDAEKKALLANRVAMLQEAQARGLITAAQLGNQAVEDAALAQLGEMLQAESRFAREQPGQAQKVLVQLGEQEQEIRGRMGQLEARLSSQPTVDQRQIQARAMDIATANAGGKTPSREQISQAMPQAVQEAQEQAYIRWAQDKQDAQVQYQILSSQLNTIRQQQATLTGTFRVAPSVMTPPAAPAPMAPPAPAPQGGNPMQGFLQQLNQQTPPPASVDSGVGQTTRALSMAAPEFVPALRQARTAQIADEYAKLDAPLMQADKAIADTRRELQMVQSGIRPTQTFPLDPIAARTANLTGPTQQDPRAQGEVITRLLMRLAAEENERNKALQARQQGKTQILSGLRLNTPTQSAPISVPSPGSLLSTPR